MNTRTLILLGSLLPLAACDFDPKDIGDPSGSSIDSADSTAGYSSDGPATSSGSATSTTGVDPTDPTVATSTTGVDPTTATATGTTGDDSTSNGSSTASTTTMGPPDTTTGEPSTTTSTGGEEPGPVMCDGDPKTFPAFDEQCDSKADCAAVLHTIDCCGSEKILGINKNAVDAFNEAEAACDQQYPECDCLPNPPIAEDGNSVLDPSEAQLACNAGVCETFVF
jgi:hypothetical protein